MKKLKYTFKPRFSYTYKGITYYEGQKVQSFYLGEGVKGTILSLPGMEDYDRVGYSEDEKGCKIKVEEHSVWRF